MRITGPGAPATPPTRRTDKARTGGSSFSGHIPAEEEPVETAGGLDTAGPMSGLDALLLVQSIDPDAGGGRRRANQRLKMRGEELLDRLDEIRVGLLTGTIPKARLAELARLMRSHREAGADPQLSALLDEIELRAEVELAKLTRR